MLKQGVALIVGVLALGLLVAGCGGDDDGDASAADETITKAAFVKQATAICKKSAKKLGTEVESLLSEPQGKKANKNQPSPEERLVSEILVPSFETEAEQIQALGTPSGDEDEVEAIIAGLEQVIDNLEENPQKFSEETDPFAAAEKPADAYGLKACPLG